MFVLYSSVMVIIASFLAFVVLLAEARNGGLVPLPSLHPLPLQTPSPCFSTRFFFLVLLSVRSSDQFSFSLRGRLSSHWPRDRCTCMLPSFKGTTPSPPILLFLLSLLLLILLIIFIFLRLLFLLRRFILLLLSSSIHFPSSSSSSSFSFQIR